MEIYYKYNESEAKFLVKGFGFSDNDHKHRNFKKCAKPVDFRDCFSTIDLT